MNSRPTIVYRLSLALLLLLAGLNPAAMTAMDYLGRFTAEEKVTISGIATDRSGNTYICGYTAQPSAFPGAIRIGATNATGLEADAFIMKFAADGTRLATTLLGGEGSDSAVKIAVDASGNVVVIGSTTSRSFPVFNALRSSLSGDGDIFISKFDSSCTNLIFSTYMGGREYESPTTLGIDGQGEIFFAGVTASHDFPARTDPLPWRQPGSGAFLAKLSSDGSQLRFASRFGGSSYDSITAMTVDGGGNVYLTGTTGSLDFPTLNALQPAKPFSSYESGFVTKISPEGATVFSTFLSGDYHDRPEAIAVNSIGEVFVAGNTHSQVFPALGLDSFAMPTNSVRKAFFVRINAAGSEILDTRFYRHSEYDRFTAIAVSPDDKAIAACNVGGYLGIPFFVVADESGPHTPAVGRPGCASLAGVEAMAFDSAGRLVAIGREFGAVYPAIDSFLARYGTNEWQASPVQVKILSHVDGRAVSSREPTFISAAVVGATSEVASVKFYDGRRLIGTATNNPFSVVWKMVTRRWHNVTAVATIGGRSVTSCVVRVKGSSPRNDSFAGRIPLRGDKIEVIGDTSTALGEGYPFYGDAPAVWYAWRCPREGIYQVEVMGVPPNDNQTHYLDVFTGSRVKNLVRVGSGSGPVSLMTLRARRGHVYQILVSAYYWEVGPFRLRIRAVTPPANDNFANATVLTGGSLSVTATTRDATSEPSEGYSQPYGYAGAPTVWFSWTAPSSGLFLAAVKGMGYPPYFSCYTGNSISNLTSVGQRISGETNGIALYAQAGTRYYLSLFGWNTNNLVLSIAPCQPPLNDQFADRLSIPFGLNSATGTLMGATKELGEPGYYSSSSHGSVWWTWRPQTSGVYRVTVTSFTVPVVGSSGVYGGVPSALSSRPVEVYSGDNVGQLISLTGTRGFRSQDTVFRAVEGTDYQIAVVGGFARFALDIYPIASPTNDNFRSAIEMSGSLTAKVGSTVGTTLEPGERYRGVPLPGSSSSESVWYRWVAPSNGFFSFSADGASLLELYQGDTFDESNLLAAGANTHVVALTGGTEYRLAVVGGDRFTLQIRPAQRPPNDDFANRQMISGLLAGFGVNAKDATAEPGEPRFQGNSPARRSVWFSWTAPTNGGCLLRSTNSDSPRISVYTGDALTALTLIASGQGSFGVEFTVRAGTTYQIAAEPDDFYYKYSAQLGLELSYRPPPRNDDFANRLPLTGATVSITASNIGATLEAGEPFNSNYAGGQTVWWTWRAPRTGRATFAVSGFGSILRLYTGLWPTRLTPLVDTNGYESEFNLPVQAGVDYQISVDRNIWSSSGQFQLGIHYTTAPTNDDFARRQSFNEFASGDLEGGSLEPGEPDTDFSDWASSVWWTWTAPSNGSYRFEASSQSYSYYFSGGIALFSGESIATLQRVGGDSSRSSSYFYAQVLAGTTYVVRVAGWGTSSPYTLTATLVPPPANDNFADRTLLTGTNISITASNIGATYETGEKFNTDRAGRQTVWWTWRAPWTGQATFAVTDYYWILNLYTGTDLAQLTPLTDTNLIGSEFNLPVQAGVDYQISVDWINWYESGQFDLSIRYTSTPPNDDFAQRQPFTDLASGELEGGSLEAEEPEVNDSRWTSSVWWTWTAPSDGTYRFEATAQSHFYGSLELFTGDTLADLQRARQDPSYSSSRIHVRVDAGTTYAVRVVGRGTGTPYTLTATFVPAPANDNFANRIQLTGTNVSLTASTLAASLEAGEPFNGSFDGGQTVWWTWRAPLTGRATFSLNNPSQVLKIFTGASLAQLTLLTDTNRRDSEHNLMVQAGVDYQVSVDRATWSSSTEFRLDIRYTPVPPNDDFARRQPFTGLASGELEGGSLEAEEPEVNDSRWTSSVWWTWTAPSNGTYRFEATAQPYPAASLELFTGDTLVDLQRVEKDPYYSSARIHVRVTAGVTYLVRVVGEATSKAYTLTATFVPPPANDNFADRIRLSGTNTSVTASNIAATLEAGEPFNNDYSGGQTVWWTWRAPLTGRASFVLNDYYGILNVYTGSELTRLTPLTDTNGFASEYNLVVLAGVDYQVSVERLVWNITGRFDLGIRYTSTPPNDEFARRRPFADLAIGELEGGSLEADELFAFDPSPWLASVWWTWTAPSNGFYRFEAKPQAGGNFYGHVTLFTGDTLPDLQYVQTDPSHHGSYIYAQVTDGTNYVVRVTDGSASAPYVLTVTFAPASANDNFAERIPLTGTNISVVGSNRTATAQTGEPEHKGDPARKSIWWTWTAPSSGSVRIALPHYSRQRVAVYTGDALESLQIVGDSYGTASFDAAQGTTYQVAIDTQQWSEDGVDEFIWSLIFQEQAPPPPPLLIPAGIGALGIIETSTNLVDWIPYTNAPVDSAGFRIVPSTNEPHRFFRVR